MAVEMVTVAEAKKIIAEKVTALPAVEVPLMEAAHHTLAQDVYAAIDIPAFEQSSMDGYAIRFADKELPLQIIGEMAAGTDRKISIGAGEAARIFTGAPLPDGADTVVMQEKVVLQNGGVTMEDAGLKQGSNVRHKGAEIKAGSLAMQQGTTLSPAAIGFLAGMGLVKLAVYPAPSVSIIVTGRELQAPGHALSAGQVYESNSFSLRAALQQARIRTINVIQSDDDLTVLKNLLAGALTSSDVVVVTGGVSVGDYDFVVEATRLCGVQQQFHKVKQKPGKPLYFGMKEAKPVFGLPGNPSSVLSCFYNYVLPALEAMSDKKNSVQNIRATITKNIVKPKGLAQFLKGHHIAGKATPLGAQESFQLSSFAQANCLICLEEERTEYAEGEAVEIYLLPGYN